MNAESCLKHRDMIDAPGAGGIYYPWVCECPDYEYLDPKDVAGYTGSELVQCRDCTVITPLLGFMRTPQDMGECPMCGGPVDNV